MNILLKIKDMGYRSTVCSFFLHKKISFCVLKLLYCQWKGRDGGGASFPTSLDAMWNIPEQLISALLTLPFSTELTGSKLLWWPKLTSNGCRKDIRWRSCSASLKPIPGDCVCKDDRRERAQLDSWPGVVNLSYNILLRPPSFSEKSMVLMGGRMTEGSGLSPCISVTCFPIFWMLSFDEDPR